MNGNDGLYSEKSADYFGTVRRGAVGLLPERVGDVLDIGGGNGATSRHLLAEGRARSSLVMDPFSTADDDGALRFSRGSADDPAQFEDMREAGSQFDTLLFLDVLEHLYDPWSVLRSARSLLRPAGHVLISVPNARFVGLVVPLVLRGRFDYKQAGVMDRTHIRWFTRSTLMEMIEGAGFRVEEVRPYFEPRMAPINRMTLGLLEGFFVYQYHVRAYKA